MKTEDFDFELPSELIAQTPLSNRVDSKLLHFDKHSKAINHKSFATVIDALEPGDLLVLNDTMVIPARLYGKKETGGQIEMLIERLLSDKQFIAHIKASKGPKPGQHVYLDRWQVRINKKEGSLYYCELMGEACIDDMLSDIGHIPLPPYIDREDEDFDIERYQTVYAKHKGSVAAPTAGLHFNDAMLDAIRKKGVNIGYVTLHVGSGTFQPVRVDDITKHDMHSEVYEISQGLCDAIAETQARGGRIIAVGTTSMRTLESAATRGVLEPHQSETNIFIYPGYTFKLCDGLITNFHLPKSTLLMLVAAFIGYEEMMMLYQNAVEQQYRFFSYGDACLLL